MSDDELRQACEEIAETVMDGTYYDPTDCEEPVTCLLRFARQQQAVGVRMAVQLTKSHHAPSHWYWAWLERQCEAKAKELES